jgi:rhodanese-related sulfurtransferase
MSGIMSFFTKQDKGYQNISSGELEKVISENGTVNLIDVRTEAEHMSGHIPNSDNINLMSPQFASKLDSLDKNQTYYVYCQSGNRSKTACSAMVNKGFKEVYNLDMGMFGWTGEIE